MRTLLLSASLLPMLSAMWHTDHLTHSRAFSTAQLTTTTPIRLSADSADVAHVVEAFHGALAAGDTAAALHLLAPDVVIQESGGVESRADYAGHHLAGDIAFARAVPSVRSGVHVTVAGDVAWASSTSTTKGMWKERAINSAGAELMVLTRSSGQWSIRAIHWSSHAIKS